MIGTTLGRYRILEPLGQGGMGRVFLAEDPSLHRRLAIKVLPPEFTHDPERRERLLHEARAASALNHPNIIVVHDLGESDGTLFVAMELVDGETLREWARAKPRTPLAVLQTMRQATAALQVAHAAGLVHRDLKPENMLVRRDGLLKILDFGLARSLSPEEGKTVTTPGTVMGTAPYMSPEQVLGQPAGPSSDLFSLGTILYELLTGRHPFAAESAVETMHRILHESPEPPSRVNRALTTDFDFVIAKALTKDPQRRHASARDFDVDLETLECGCGAAANPAAAGSSSGDGAKGPRAIAVLPFKNIGGNPDLNYLGVGLADAVITRLMDSPDLVVRSTGSIAVYENQAIEPRRVGQELDVTAVLDASFQRAGDRFRATARLVETPSGRALWAGKVDLGFDDIFQVQDQVAKGIADALTARLSASGGPGTPGTAVPKFTPSPEAYQLFLRGLEAHRASTTREELLIAIREFQRAVMLEPGYARAWANLGSMYHAMVDGGFESDPIWYAKAGEAIEKARAIDPDDPQVSFATGALHLVSGRRREAYREFLSTRRKTPNHSMLYHYFAYLFRLCNMLDEAMQSELKSIELDPLVAWSQFGVVRLHMLCGNFDLCEAHLQRLRPRFPDRMDEAMGELLVARGRFEEAVAHFEKLGDKELQGRTALLDRAVAYLKTGNREEALKSRVPLEQSALVDMDFAADAASLAGHLGEFDEAFRLLDRAVELGNDTAATYENPIFFGPLHADPRWKPFIAGVHHRIAEHRREFRWPLPD